jgi:hypothetical protein
LGLLDGRILLFEPVVDRGDHGRTGGWTRCRDLAVATSRMSSHRPRPCRRSIITAVLSNAPIDEIIPPGNRAAGDEPRGEGDEHPAGFGRSGPSPGGCRSSCGLREQPRRPRIPAPDPVPGSRANDGKPLR